jgi:hypothetical protein
MTIAEQQDLALKILRLERGMRDILPTEMLGQGSERSAIDFMISSNIELVPIELYNSWLRDTWGIDVSTRENQSPQVLNQKTLSTDMLLFLSEFCHEDIMLYERIMLIHRKYGGTRVFGSNL